MQTSLSAGDTSIVLGGLLLPLWEWRGGATINQYKAKNQNSRNLKQDIFIRELTNHRSAEDMMIRQDEVL